MSILSECTDTKQITGRPRIQIFECRFNWPFSVMSIDTLTNQLTQELEKIPICDICEERLAEIINKFIYPPYQGKFKFYHIGDRGRRTSDPMIFEYMMVSTRYSRPCGVAVSFC